MENIQKMLSKDLLQIKAIKLEPANPFTWASGWKSPIYCDNRKTLSYPNVRNRIRDAFASLIQEYYPQADIIAGVATGAIAHGILVAEKLNMPFVYIRSSSKSHGLTNQIEGDLSTGNNVVVIEDLISTGGSSLAAVQALRDAGANVMGLMAIFSYNFDIAKQNFEKMHCKYQTITDYDALLHLALETGYIHEKDLQILQQWRTAPESWAPNKT